MPETVTEIVEDPEALARTAADRMLAALRSIGGRTSICLSGGSTPRQLYRLLGSPELRDSIPWGRLHWFWGDERFVPPDHPDSNFRMVREALFDTVPVPPAQIYPIDTVGLEPEQSAAIYERTLKLWYGREDFDPNRPLFDVTLLGLGEDGHTASLFPGNRALEEPQHWATAVTDTPAEARVTLTLNTLGSSRLVRFLVSGANKHAVLQRLRSGETLPASRVRAVGATLWLVDHAASL